MNARRSIFLAVFGLYQISVFLFTTYIDSQRSDFNFLIKMFEQISLFKWGALVGVILFVIEFFWSRNDAKKMANP